MKLNNKSCGWPTIYRGFISGRVQSCVIFDSMRKEDLCQLLPLNFRLARQTLSPPGQHPIYWLFNLNEINVSTPIPMLCLNYHEFGLVIPRVHDANRKGAIGAYVPTLHLNSILGVLGGKVIYQLPKRWSRCELSSATFESDRLEMTVHRLLGDHQIIKATFEKDGPPRTQDELAHFKVVKPMLDEPLLTAGWLGNRSSEFVLEYDEVKIQPIRAQIETGDFLPQFQHMTRDLPSIQESPFGGFYFDLNWTLYLPKK